MVVLSEPVVARLATTRVAPIARGPNESIANVIGRASLSSAAVAHTSVARVALERRARVPVVLDRVAWIGTAASVRAQKDTAHGVFLCYV